MKVQSILFDRDYFTKTEAKEWAKKNKYKYGYVDITENNYRIRQESPTKFDKYSFRTISFDKNIKAIVACPKGKSMATRKRRRNSAVRINPDDNAEITISIKGPKEALSQMQNLSSDLAMIAGKEGISSTRGNPRRKRRTTKPRTNKEIKSMTTKVFGNPIHIPKTTRGRPSSEKWWILDLYDGKGKKITTEIGKGAKRSAEYEAASKIGHRARGRSGPSRIVRSAALSGPYARKPNSRTARK